MKLFQIFLVIFVFQAHFSDFKANCSPVYDSDDDDDDYDGKPLIPTTFGELIERVLGVGVILSVSWLFPKKKKPIIEDPMKQ